MESVRSMLIGLHLPQRFWPEALSTAIYLRNKSSTKPLSGFTPYEAWTGVKPSVNHLKVFGCTAYRLTFLKKKEERWMIKLESASFLGMEQYYNDIAYIVHKKKESSIAVMLFSMKVIAVDLTRSKQKKDGASGDQFT